MSGSHFVKQAKQHWRAASIPASPSTVSILRLEAQVHVLVVVAWLALLLVVPDATVAVARVGKHLFQPEKL